MLATLNFKLIWAILATLLLIIGYLPYLRDIFNRKTKPHIYTWLIWAITQGTATLILLQGGGKFGGLSLLVGTILVLVVFFLSFRYGTLDISRSDKIFLLLALLAIIIWWQLKNPVLAVLLVSLIDALGYLPTIRKTFKNPRSETLSFWIMMALVDIFALASNAKYNLLTTVYLATILVANLLMVYICLFHKPSNKDKITNNNPTSSFTS